MLIEHIRSCVEDERKRFLVCSCVLVGLKFDPKT